MSNFRANKSFFGGLFVCLATASIAAQEVPRPDINIGDRWLYERTDRTKGVADGTREQKLVSKSDAEYRFEFKSSLTGNVTTFVQDLNTNSIEINGRKMTPFVPFYSWPLATGKKWTAQFSGPNTAGTGVYSEERTCEVGRYEGVDPN